MDEVVCVGEGFCYIKLVLGLFLREYFYGGGWDEEFFGVVFEGGVIFIVVLEIFVLLMWEICYFFNVIILFLFWELWDIVLICCWVIKKIKVEFEELL